MTASKRASAGGDNGHGRKRTGSKSRATTNRGKPRQSILSPSLSSSSGSEDGDADEVVATRRKKLALERRNLDEGAFGGGDTAKNAGRGGNAAEDDGRDSEGPIADGDGFDAGSDVEVESGASNRRASTEKKSSRKSEYGRKKKKKNSDSDSLFWSDGDSKDNNMVIDLAGD